MAQVVPHSDGLKHSLSVLTAENGNSSLSVGIPEQRDFQFESVGPVTPSFVSRPSWKSHGGVITTPSMNHRHLPSASRKSFHRSFSRLHGSLHSEAGSDEEDVVNNPTALYDIVKDEEEEDMQKDKCPQWIRGLHVILPTDPFRQFWDALVAIFVLYLSWLVPFSVCFPADFLDTDQPWVSLSLILDIFFWIDILLNFRTGYIDHGTIHTGSFQMAKHYFRGWFFIDLFASLPFEEIFEDAFAKSQRKAVKVGKIFKLSKLLRMGRIVKYLRAYFAFRHFFTLAITLIFSIHWWACLWFLTESLDNDLRWNEVLDGETTLNYQYAAVIHEVVSVMFGIDEIRDLESTGQNILSLFVILCGAGLMAFLTAIIVNLINSKSTKRELFRGKMEAINREMDRMHLNAELKQRIKKYYDYLWINEESEIHGTNIFQDSDLSSSLRNELVVHFATYTIPLRSVPHFAEFSDELLASIIMSMKTHVFMPKDLIYVVGTLAKELMYVTKGHVVLQQEIKGDEEDEDIQAMPNKYGFIEDETALLGYTYSEYHIGTFFGSDNMVSDLTYDSTLMSITFSELHVLHKDAFLEVLQDFPEFAAKVHDTMFQALMSEHDILVDHADRLHKVNPVLGSIHNGPKDSFTSASPLVSQSPFRTPERKTRSKSVGYQSKSSMNVSDKNRIKKSSVTIPENEVPSSKEFMSDVIEANTCSRQADTGNRGVHSSSPVRVTGGIRQRSKSFKSPLSLEGTPLTARSFHHQASGIPSVQQSRNNSYSVHLDSLGHYHIDSNSHSIHGISNKIQHLDRKLDRIMHAIQLLHAKEVKLEKVVTLMNKMQAQMLRDRKSSFWGNSTPRDSRPSANSLNIPIPEQDSDKSINVPPDTLVDAALASSIQVSGNPGGKKRRRSTQMPIKALPPLEMTEK